MERSIYLKISVTALILLTLFFGIVTVNSLDRLRESNLLLADRIASMPAAAGKYIQPRNEVKPSADAANAEFFDPAAEEGGRLIQVMTADTQNMNPLINNDAAVALFYSYCNSSLAARNYGAPDKLQPLMAESWEISPDRKTYRIKLRKGIKWHDFTDPVSGKKWRNVEVTSADFKFLIDTIQNPDVNCAHLRVYYQDLEGVDIVNDYEFTVRWKKAYYGSVNATLGMSPLPRHLYHAYDGPFDGKKFNDDFARNRVIVGCGPYRFMQWEKDVRILFKRFDGYFGRSLGIMPPLEYIVFELIKNPNTQMQALLSGQIDRMSLSPEQWMRRTGGREFADGTLRKYHYPAKVYFYIGYNQQNKLFADRRVRQAMTMLTDRGKILRDILFSLGTVAGGPLAPDSIYSHPSLKPWPYDPSLAKKLLAEAGWQDSNGDGILDRDGEKFSFSVMTVSNHPVYSRILPVIKESMAQAGVDMKIMQMDWAVCLQRLNDRNFDSCIMGWTMPEDPDFYQIFHSSQADIIPSSNFISYRSGKLDKLIEELRITFDMERRKKLCHRIAEILHEDQPYTFLYIPYSLQALSGRYRNVRIFPDGVPDDILWTPGNMQKPVPGIY